jgi:hypothetical protein
MVLGTRIVLGGAPDLGDLWLILTPSAALQQPAVAWPVSGH